MLEPIVLTQFGETLIEQEGHNLKDTNAIFNVYENRIIEKCIAVHDICRGFIDCKPVSKTHNVILCRACGLRINIPIVIATYGQLRQWCEYRRSLR